MRKEVCAAFLEKFLLAVAEGRGNEPQENPAVLFTKNVKEGLFDGVSDEKYEKLLDDQMFRDCTKKEYNLSA